MQNKFSLQS